MMNYRKKSNQRFCCSPHLDVSDELLLVLSLDTLQRVGHNLAHFEQLPPRESDNALLVDFLLFWDARVRHFSGAADSSLRSADADLKRELPGVSFVEKGWLRLLVDCSRCQA